MFASRGITDRSIESSSIEILYHWARLYTVGVHDGASDKHMYWIDLRIKSMRESHWELSHWELEEKLQLKYQKNVSKAAVVTRQCQVRNLLPSCRLFLFWFLRRFSKNDFWFSKKIFQRWCYISLSQGWIWCFKRLMEALGLLLDRENF